MKRTAETSDGKKRCRPFALAAAVYVAGAIFLTAWSYTADRSILLDRLDGSLANATLVAQSILSDAHVADLFSQDRTGGAPLNACRQSLEGVATEHGFPLVGIFGWRNGQIVPLVSGTARNGSTAADGVRIDKSVRNHLQSVLPTAAPSAKATPSLHTLEDPDQGRVRIALLYVPDKEHGGGLAYVAAVDSDPRERFMEIRDITTSLFLLAMVVPLILLFNRSQRKASQELAELNARSQQDFELQKTKEEELRDAIHDLERFNSTSVGRETRIIELKTEVNELLLQLDQPKRYNVDKIA